MWWKTSILCTVALVCASAVALAQTTDPNGRAAPSDPSGTQYAPTVKDPAIQAELEKRAKEIFAQGRTEFEAGNYRQAAAKYRRSWMLLRRPGTLFNLALSEEKLGAVASAYQHFVELLPQLASNDPRVPEVIEWRMKLRPRVPKLVLELDSDLPQGTTLLLDDSPIAPESSGKAIAIDPGEHAILVVLPGGTKRLFNVHVDEGRRYRKRIGMNAKEETSVDVYEAPRWKWPIVIAVGALGAGGVAAGAALTLESNRRGASAAEIEKSLQMQTPVGFSACGAGRPPENTHSCTRYQEDRYWQRTLRDLAITGYVIGGAALIGAVVLGASVRGMQGSDDSSERADPYRLRLLPAIGRNEGGMLLTGRF